MKPTGLHLLLTYQCNRECDHCFVYGSPWQQGTMSLRDIRYILKQADLMESIDTIYFEGGEPFLYYPILLKGIRVAKDLGYTVGLVSNAYWATDLNDALEWLTPLKGLVQDFSLSCDDYHGDADHRERIRLAREAAQQLEIPVDVIQIAAPNTENAQFSKGQLFAGESAVMYRGRAAEKLTDRVDFKPWESFEACENEDLRHPDRLHIDPQGNIHICQGISIGNIFHTPLCEICEQFNPDKHPMTAPLLKGGPSELARAYDLIPETGFADACHLCHFTRNELRYLFPDILTPEQMYGVPDS